MPLVKGLDLPGSWVRYRTGYDGHEPIAVLRRGDGLPEDKLRVAVVVGGDYPGLVDTYHNRSLVGLVQEALSLAGLHIVLEEIYQEVGPVPVEAPCSLSQDESYYLVQEDLTVAGQLWLWAFVWSDGGVFYGEYYQVVDIILATSDFGRFSSCLKEPCGRYGVTCEDWGKAERAPNGLLRQGLASRVARVLGRIVRKAKGKR